MSWVMALGLAAGTVEAAQAASFPRMAVFVFCSNAFVQTQNMPGPLRAYAQHQPVTACIDAVRALLNGGGGGQGHGLFCLVAGYRGRVRAPGVRRYRRTA